MSELINNARKRKDLLKHLILQLHDGVAPDAVKAQLTRLLGDVPYGDVVEVEQELMAEGLPMEEVMKLCDVHSAALKGSIDKSMEKTAPPGHPIHTMQRENRAIEWELAAIRELFSRVSAEAVPPDRDIAGFVDGLRTHFNALTDIEKHYQRKEHLLFPFLEKHGISGPSQVMWGKDDEARTFLKEALSALDNISTVTREELAVVIEFVLGKAVSAIDEMIYKEEQILFPMCLDTLSDREFYEMYQHSDQIGYCLVVPETVWAPTDLTGYSDAEKTLAGEVAATGTIQLPSGSFTVAELTAMLNTIPFDVTFVDANDRVKFFSQGKERIFERNLTILGREVQRCHPPKSVHTVQTILEDFRSGKQDRAAFWLTMKGRFISIEYFALRAPDGTYLGTLEVSQDLTDKRALGGEQRLLDYHA